MNYYDRLNIHLYMNTGPLLTLACALALARPQPRPRQCPPRLRRDLLQAVGQSPTIQYIMPLLPTPATPLQHSVLALGQTKSRWNRCTPLTSCIVKIAVELASAARNCSDVRRQFRKLGCLRLETITESELFFSPFSPLHNRLGLRTYAQQRRVMVVGRISCSHARVEAMLR